jgi:hypothetical protein
MRLLARVSGAVSFLLGVCLLGFIGYEDYYAHASQSWPATVGVFRDYITTYNREHQGDFGNRVDVVNDRHIFYRYTVAGVQYVGTRISFGFREHELPAPGTEATVTVYYNSSRPSQSVLFPDSPSLPWGLIALALALFGVGFVILRIGAKASESDDNSRFRQADSDR